METDQLILAAPHLMHTLNSFFPTIAQEKVLYLGRWDGLPLTAALYEAAPYFQRATFS